MQRDSARIAEEPAPMSWWQTMLIATWTGLGQSHGGLTEEEPMQAADCVIQPHMISDSRRSASS